MSAVARVLVAALVIVIFEFLLVRAAWGAPPPWPPLPTEGPVWIQPPGGWGPYLRGHYQNRGWHVDPNECGYAGVPACREGQQAPWANPSYSPTPWPDAEPNAGHRR